MKRIALAELIERVPKEPITPLPPSRNRNFAIGSIAKLRCFSPIPIWRNTVEARGESNAGLSGKTEANELLIPYEKKQVLIYNV